MAKAKPLPSSPPNMASAGNFTSSMMMSAIWLPACPIFLSDLPTLMPAVSIGTIKAETCAFLGKASLLVRAMINATFANGALVMYRFVPFNTQPLPDFTAVVCIAAESDPDPGSVRPKDAISPAAKRGSHSAFCASVPPFLNAEHTMPTLIDVTERKHGAA